MSEWRQGGLTEKVTLKQIPGGEGMHQRELGTVSWEGRAGGKVYS